MPLPWVRLDANIGTHDKILALENDSSAKKWQALWSYTVALGWSGGHGTDGHIPSYALGQVKGTKMTADLLCFHKLWKRSTDGWNIVNYANRQELELVTEAKRAAQAMGGRKARCRQNHGPECGCWREAS